MQGLRKKTKQSELHYIKNMKFHSITHSSTINNLKIELADKLKETKEGKGVWTRIKAAIGKCRERRKIWVLGFGVFENRSLIDELREFKVQCGSAQSRDSELIWWTLQGFTWCTRGIISWFFWWQHFHVTTHNTQFWVLTVNCFSV